MRPQSATANPNPKTPKSTLVTIRAAVLPSGDPGCFALARTCGALKEKGAERRVPAAEDACVVDADAAWVVEVVEEERGDV